LSARHHARGVGLLLVAGLCGAALPAAAAQSAASGDPSAPAAPPPRAPTTEPPPFASPASAPAAPSPRGAGAPVQVFDPIEVTPVAALPAAASAAPVAASPATGPAPLTMDEMPVSAAATRVSLNMFGDPSFVLNSSAPKKPAFTLSPLNFLLYGHAGRLMALSEFAFELGAGGEEILVDVERFFVGWHDQRFSIEAGRTHTELGYWNNAFHHGRWLQMTVERPRIVAFEDDGGILPIHSVGVTAKFRPLVGERQVELCGAVANGRGRISDEIQVTGDDNAFKSLLGKIELKGFGARNLRLGLVGYYDQIAPQPEAIRPALAGVLIQEAIGNAYVAYRGSDLTLISEGYEIVHLGGGRHFATLDSFLLLAYRFGLVAPYAVGEVRAGDINSDPFFFPGTVTANDELLGRFKEITLGVRFDITTWSAIKVEYRGTSIEGQSSTVQRGIVDWSFGL
jgi:hypothetical protein